MKQPLHKLSLSLPEKLNRTTRAQCSVDKVCLATDAWAWEMLEKLTIDHQS